MVEKKSIIYDKLESFIKKYYTNELIKGSLLFIAIGLLYFIFTFLIEYVFWFSTSGRSILFWSFSFNLIVRFGVTIFINNVNVQFIMFIMP